MMDFYQTEWLRRNGTDASALEEENRVQILGEIVGATNLVAAKRVKGDNENQDSSEASVQANNATISSAPLDIVSAYCVIYWGEDVIHETKVISKNNNPIWSCDTGSLFMFDLPDEEYFLRGKCLRVEVFDKVSKKQHESIGEVILEGFNFVNENWCDEKRRTFELIKERKDDSDDNESNFFRKGDIVSSVSNFVSAGITWLDENLNSQHSDVDDVDDEDSLYGKSVSSKDETEIDDDFVFGKTGTIALRFRVASEDDKKFLKAVKIFEKGYQYAKRKGNQTLLAGVKRILHGKSLAPLITESSSSMMNFCTSEEIQNIVDFRIFGMLLENGGVKRYRVKPYPNPNRPVSETQYLTETEMQELVLRPSTKWVEAGSGSLGRVYVEILSCEGLPNKNMGKALGNKADPFVCLIYEDCLVETDVIRNCQNPYFMPWAQRAFMFNTMNALSSLYLGVFDHDFGPFNHKGIGRITVDLSELKHHTEYVLKYNLYSSPATSNRKIKGSITIRIQVAPCCEKQSLISMFNPPVIHVNVKRRKTLAVARYTCYGKYREEVYNMKVLRGFIDEFFEYLEQISSEINYSFDSLFFWRGQVSFLNVDLPLYSAAAYFSAIYVIERPHLIPSYFFFCCACIFLTILGNRSNYPAPLYRSKSFFYHLNSFLPSRMQKALNGEDIDAAEGYDKAEEMKQKKLKRMEANKQFRTQIANIRREMQLFLVSLSDLSLHTNEDGVKYNPMSRLLPIQLLLKELMFFIRCAKSILCCEDSAISFILIVGCFSISFVLLFIPCGRLFHFICRLFVWLIMGPWMRIAEMIANRKGSARHLQKVKEEMKEREQKRLVEARILKEEALKLKATRTLRFGRFAIRVPFTNLTRYRDQPLPESHSQQSDIKFDPTASIRSLIDVCYIPGQKHHGVMIPELSNPNQNKISEKRLRGDKDLRTQSKNKKKRNFLFSKKKDLLSNQKRKRSISFRKTKDTMSLRPKVIVEAKECDCANEEGFELILDSFNNKGSSPSLMDPIYDTRISHKAVDSQEICDDRNDIQVESRPNEQTEERVGNLDTLNSCIDEKVINPKVNFVLSDLTDNWT